jgi:hypothetical protein
MYTINDYIKYYYLDIVYEEGTLTEGDNIISEALPVTDIPENDIVFRTYVDEDSSCRYTLFLNSSDGKIHCIVIPLYEVSIENDVLKKTALIASTSISAQAICLTA